MVGVWIQFAACAAFICLAGIQVSRYGDVIAEKTGVSRGWIGLILMATVTSLPELVTGVSAVTAAQTPDIALGDVLGSCVFNLTLIAVVDALGGRKSVWSDASRGHLLSAGFGVVLIGFAVMGVTLAAFGVSIRVGHVGAMSMLLVPIYMIAVSAIFRHERDLSIGVEVGEIQYPHVTLRSAVLRYVVAALIVVVAGSALPFVAEHLAEAMGWDQTFVGNLFVAFVTSLPELVVTFAAARLGALDLAVGNLLGSNLFNMLIVAIDDLLFFRGPLLAATSPAHAISGLTAIVMTGCVTAGLITRTRTRIGPVGWPSLALALLYLVNVYGLYRAGVAHP